MRREFQFPLEYEKDPVTNKSEVETLLEISNRKDYSVSRTIREYVLNGMNKDEHMLSRNPKLDQFIGEESKPEKYIPMEPTLADYTNSHKEFIEKSNFSREELRRREQRSMDISKLYYQELQKQEEKEYQESRKLTIEQPDQQEALEKLR